MQFFFSPVVGVLSDRYGRRPVILLSNLGLGLDYIVMALSPTIGWLFVGRVISGITTSSVPTAIAYISDVTPKEKRAGAFGMIGVAFGIGFSHWPCHRRSARGLQVRVCRFGSPPDLVSPIGFTDTFLFPNRSLPNNGRPSRCAAPIPSAHSSCSVRIPNSGNSPPRNFSPTYRTKSLSFGRSTPCIDSLGARPA